MSEKTQSAPQRDFEERRRLRTQRAATPGAEVLIPSSSITRELLSYVKNVDNAARRLQTTFFTSDDKKKYEEANKVIGKTMETLEGCAKEMTKIAGMRYIPSPSERAKEREAKAQTDDKTMDVK